MPKVSLKVERGPHVGLARAEIVRRVEAMLGALQLEDVEVSILLTDDVQIQKLNRDYREKDKPTDVLAFAQREGDFGSLAGDLLGDVIVSVPTARRQAVKAKRGALDEVTMLLAHGLLHLLGWDHVTATEDRRMRRETDRLCAAAAPVPTRAAKRTAPAPRVTPPPSVPRKPTVAQRKDKRAR